MNKEEPKKEEPKKPFWKEGWFWWCVAWGAYLVILLVSLIIVPIVNNTVNHWGWTAEDYIAKDKYDQAKALQEAQERAATDAAWQAEHARINAWRASDEYWAVIGDVWSQYWWAIILLWLFTLWQGSRFRLPRWL